MTALLHLAAGLLLGLGLLLSGMAEPARVLGFLDLGGMARGAWDPSLAFVLLGAVGMAALGYRLAWRRPRPWHAAAFHLPAARRIDAPLVLGALLFGVGWGLAGICPGPALVLVGARGAEVLAFLLPMLAGMALARWLRAGLRQP
ncbi:YeeE/YedE family protein [Roseomonas sp. GC11]|uniref:DUF6691 family protein n=1 Tax=Roseomonas sp. GC11 TaxID=2950546 RepID=UPI00210CC388|nr:DUF6691 family protein [Roseomonas sp. GC11]MCQ4162975.1 YeeE/YedE family protein [Roseomonas sp. GC11]